MDLNPITVLTGSKAPAPPATHAAPNSAKQSFASVLSAHAPAETHRSQPKSVESKSENEAKKVQTKNKSTEASEPNPKQAATETKGDPTISELTGPIETRNVPAPAPEFALCLIDPSTKAVPVDSAQPSNVNQTAASTDCGNRNTGNAASLIPTGIKEAPKTQGRNARLHAPPVVPQDGRSSSLKTGAPQPKDVKISSGPFLVVPAPVKSDSEAAETVAITKAPVAALDASVERTEPRLSRAADAQKVAEKDSVEGDATKQSSPTEPAQTFSDLVSAAQKIGIVISASAHTPTAKPAITRPVTADLKAAVGPGKIGPKDLARTPQAPTTASFQKSVEKHEAVSPATSEPDTTDSKASADAAPKETSASVGARDKPGTSATVAAPQATPAQPRGIVPSGPSDSGTHQPGHPTDPNALPFNRADAPPASEFGVLSKTSLIERFRQSELHFGMQAGEFGRIEVRTLLDHHEMTARISVERGDLGRALQTELPGLQKRLSDLDVPMARITLHEQSAAMSGESSRRSREQQWSNQYQASIPRPESELRISTLPESSIATDGLSIRI